VSREHRDPLRPGLPTCREDPRNHLASPDWHVEVVIPGSFPAGTHEVHTGCRLASGADVGFLYETTTLRVVSPSAPPGAPVAAPPVAVPVSPRFTG
jgi:hypothetical protein